MNRRASRTGAVLLAAILVSATVPAEAVHAFPARVPSP